ncbi:ester cyclase [Streptomyces sp. CWNU-52B]|uniref:ester cyclase n=1 Tax=unclassified Streptomyces TaxID=2593676 RepID=UPI0039C202E6
MTTDTTADPKTMVDAWLRLWNGDLSLVPGLVTDDFPIHTALAAGGDSSAIQGAAGLTAFISEVRSVFPDLEFTIEVPPVIDGAYLSVRWSATGTYGGGFPGAKAEPGTVVTFTGTDTLFARDGRFAEYWLNSDSLDMLRQLKVL